MKQFIIFLSVCSISLSAIVGKCQKMKYFIQFVGKLPKLFTPFLDVTEYWPELKDDLTKVIWSHATNSKVKLQTALEGKITSCFSVTQILREINFGEFRSC